jgi:ribosome biogenesis ATPase
LAKEVDVSVLAHDKRCTGFSGADLSSLVREAATAALAEAFNTSPEDLGSPVVTLDHFEQAFSRVSPSVSESDAKRYDSMQKTMTRSRLK